MPSESALLKPHDFVQDNFRENTLRTSKIFAAAIVLAALTACDKKEAATAPAQPSAAASDKESQASPLVSRDQPVNAAPLGIEIGYANLAGVKAKLGAVTKLEEQGINQYSGGPMLVSNGEGVGVDGLSQLTLIFDKNDVLAAVLMKVPKAAKDMMGKLSGKYQVVDNKIDNFMGYGYAKLKKGDSLVEIDAPHLSFQMEVRYMTKQLMSDFQQQSAEEEARKRQEQTNKL